jgi:hypothetical protein
MDDAYICFLLSKLYNLLLLMLPGMECDEIENTQTHYVTYLWILRNVTGQSCDVTLLEDSVSQPQWNVTGPEANLR